MKIDSKGNIISLIGIPFHETNLIVPSLDFMFTSIHEVSILNGCILPKRFKLTRIGWTSYKEINVTGSHSDMDGFAVGLYLVFDNNMDFSTWKLKK